MRWFAYRAFGFLIAGLLLANVPAAMAATVKTPVYLIDPFLAPSLEPSFATLSNLSLQSYIGNTAKLEAMTAKGLVADGTSAAILIFPIPAGNTGSVVFTATGVVLLPYSDTFMTTSPATGAANLTISSGQFINVSGQNYAVALVQSPVPTAAVLTKAAAITLVQGKTKVSTTLTILPPPVILVHGLWGDSTSLAHTQATLDKTAPWSSHKNLVIPIQYSPYVAFDAEGNADDPATILGTSILSAFAALDAGAIVGGRVDIVAHSMGGLVARYYSSLKDIDQNSTYTTLRDRNQGQFRAIVTLDTPELGSGLAQLLLNLANSTYVNIDNPKVNDPKILWDDACGSPSTTVATCFYNEGLPLAAGNDYTTGAVYSLVPTNHSLQNIASVSPKIPNAAWLAVASTAPAKSLLRDVLQNLIDATYTHTANAVTLNTALGNSANDVIVTVPSQESGASAGQIQTFTNLQHTTAPSEAKLLFASDSNASVVTSASVDKVVLCWLKGDGGGKCLSSKALAGIAEAAAAEPAAVAPAATSKATRSVEWIDVQQPSGFALATPAEIAINIASPGLIALTLSQRDELGHHIAAQPLAITSISGLTAYAEITPMLMGSVTFTLTARFQDGSVSSQRLTSTVAGPASTPSAFVADANFDTIRLGLEPGTLRTKLHPVALYPGSETPVSLDGRVDFALQSDGSPSPIQLGADGSIEAVRPGTAVVDAHFSNAVAQVQIIVAPIEH